MKTNCPKCSAHLGIKNQRMMRCNHCGELLSYNALPFRFLLSLVVVALSALLLPTIIPASSSLWRFQPVLISGLVILAVIAGLKEWQLYRSREEVGSNKSLKTDDPGGPRP